MFFILSKTFIFFLQPMVWIFLLLLFGFFFNKGLYKRQFVKISIITFLFFSNTIVFLEFVRIWEVPGVKVLNMQHHDIGVVLGGMTEYNGELDRLSLRRGADRIWQAIQLYKAKKIDKILISGAHGHLIDRGLIESVQLKEDLIRLGIPEADILTESISKNTHENAIESKKIIDGLANSPSVLLITSALHMKRAKACFLKAGFVNFGVFSTDHFTGVNRGYQFDQYIIPNIFTFAIWKTLIKEWVGYATYSMMGYL